MSGPLLTWQTGPLAVEKQNCRLLETTAVLLPVETAVLLPLFCLRAKPAHCHKQPMSCLTAAGLTQPVETRDCRVPIPFASSYWGSPVSRLGVAYLQGI